MKELTEPLIVIGSIVITALVLILLLAVTPAYLIDRASCSAKAEARMELNNLEVEELLSEF